MNKAVKILIVDDRQDNLLSIETILEKENYTIVKASSGRGRAEGAAAGYRFLAHPHGRADAGHERF